MSITLKNVRRQVAGFSLAMMIASMFAIGVAQAATFADVQPTDWSYPYVEELAAGGILDTTKTNYEPAREVNRAEMAKLAVEAWGLTLETPTEPPFKDVALGVWYTPYIYTALKNNVLGGYKDTQGTLTGYYGPGDALTREQAMKIVTLSANLATNTQGGPHFSDVPLSRWSYEYVETGYNWSIVDGFPGTSLFKPDQNVLRDQIAKMVSNAMFPVVRPGAGFNVDDAYSTAVSKVYVCFSSEVGDGAEDVDNYEITDANANVLNVTAANIATDPMCVELTTASQTEGKSYNVVVSGVMSANDEELAIADISFTGYSALGTGGDLTCSAGVQPAGVSVPIGATGIPFTVVNCQASGDSVVVTGMTFHRFGAGNQGDFDNVYLYQNDMRLTSGRTVNSETQNVEFTGLNYTVGSSGVSFVVVGDIGLGAAPASQHGFELLSEDGIASNAGSVGGTYPIVGNLMTISGAVAGSISIEANGALDDLTIGESGRIAQFQLEAGGTEAMELHRMALYIRGTCASSNVTDLKLYEMSGELLAETDMVGAKDLATFVLADPYLIGQGDSKLFYVEANVSCRNAETVKTYLEQTTDLYVTGVTYGTGVRVDRSLPLPGNYDGTGTGFSQITVKGSDFNAAFNGPAASDVAVGQSQVSCLDLTLSNKSGQTLDIKDWNVKVEATTGDPAVDAKDLYDVNPNYTLFKLAKKNADGTYGSSLLGPVDLKADDTTACVAGVGNGDVCQMVKLAGSNTIGPDEVINASVIFNVANNVALNGNKIRCTLMNLTTAGSDYIRDENGDELGAASITPSSNIVGNIFTLNTSALTLDVAATPSNRNYVAGTTDAPLLGLTARSGSSLSNTIKSIALHGYVDNDNEAAVDSFDGSGTDAADAADATSTSLKDIVGTVKLYVGETMVKEANVGADGRVSFNNLTIEVPKSTSVNLMIKGSINPGAPYGSLPDRLKFGIDLPGDVVAIDSNGKNVPGTSITNNAANNAVPGTGDETGIFMTIVSGGSGTTTNTTSAAASVLVGESKKELARVRFTSSNESPILKDLQFGILNGNGASVSRIYIAPLTGGTCGAIIGDTNGYGNSNGIFTITDLGVTIPDSSSLTLCVLGDVTQVGPLGPPASQPVSGSGVGVVLLNVTEVTGGSGSNISAKYVSDQTGGESLAAALAAGATTVVTSNLVAFPVGSVVVVDQEMMLVTADAGANLTVVRGFGNTVDAAHTNGTIVGLSTLAVNSAQTVVGAHGAAATCINVGVLAPFKAGDVIAVPVGAAYDYSLVTDATGLCAATSLTVVRGLYGSTALAYAGGEAITRFSVHGDLFKLRRSRPTITQIPVTVTNLPGTPRTRIFGFKVAATGQDDVQFTNANGNVIEVTVGGTIAGGVALCTLTDGITDYDTDATGLGVNIFDFVDSPLTISPGSSVDLFVECDTTAVALSGENISAQLVKAPTTIQWCDGSMAVPCNIPTDGSLVIPSTITGSSFTMP